MLKHVYRRLNNSWRQFRFYSSINWIKTLYFNFKMLPFRQAKKLPVIFYGKVKFTGLRGKVTIEAPVKFGLIGFGRNLEIIRQNIGKSEIGINGFFNIKGSFNTGNDYAIHVLPGAYFEIGDGSYIGSQTKIIVTNFVKIGKGFRFGFESQLSDSNYHYTIDLTTKQVSRFTGEIEISNYCWIGNRTTIMKGTKTPQFLIVASNSILNKDYTKSVSENSLIGGMPAKLIRDNIVRVFDENLEKEIHRFFRENPNNKFYTIK